MFVMILLQPGLGVRTIGEWCSPRSLYSLDIPSGLYALRCFTTRCSDQEDDRVYSTVMKR
ncbi:hypothetical protein EF834_14555 [Rhodococcus spongiicola]|uniref:Uncharacterized protein n=2 Tax=Rhodococcus spongiicola TaxID=2487352 RepID=A0A3S3DZ81_9NOCA|nr:hypothetical protein EF834_14555 [Rhodococcus spongiicola]